MTDYVANMLDRFVGQFPEKYQSWVVPVTLYLFALIVRLVYLNQISSLPTFDFPIMDEKYHTIVADQILNGQFDSDAFYRAPFYLYFLSFLFKLTSSSLYWSRFLQILITSFLPLTIYLLGRRLFDRKIAFYSALVAIIYPTFLYFDSTLLITSIMTLLTTLLVLQFYSIDIDRHKGFIVAGLLLGLAGLARPNILLLGPVLIIWAWFILKPKVGTRKALTRYFLIGLASLVVILPVTIRNYVVSNDYVFIAWQGGFNFFLGNNQSSLGWSATAPGIDQSWDGGYRQAITIAEQASGRQLKRSEISDYWFGIGWQEIKKNPANFLALQFKKLRLFFNGYEIPNNQDLYLSKSYSGLMNLLLLKSFVYWPYGLLAPLALFGLLLTVPKWRKYLLLYLVLGSYLVSLQLFFVCARYRQPLIPLMILLSVYAVSRIYSFVLQKHWRAVVLALLVITGLAIESNHDLLQLPQNRIDAENYHLIGNAYLEQGNLVAAQQNFSKSIEADSTFVLGYINLGMIHAQRGSRFEAASLFNRAISIDPYTIEAFYNLATVYIQSREYEKAIDLFQRAESYHPLNDMLQLRLALTYYEISEFDLSRIAVNKCLQLNRENANARRLLAELNKQH